MRNSQADTPLGSLLNRSILPENYQGESKVKFKISPGKYSIFDYFTFLISAFVVNGRSINKELYFKVFFECEEKLRRTPEARRNKAKAFFHLNKYPWDFIFSYPEHARYTLRLENLNDTFLLSKRAQGSEKWKSMLDIQGEILLYPGLPKEAFPEVRYIGVGYRDKGSSRDKSHDGTPSWQTVAMNLGEEVQQIDAKQPRNVHLDRLCLSYDEHLERQARRLKKRLRESRERYQSISL